MNTPSPSTICSHANCRRRYDHHWYNLHSDKWFCISLDGFVIPGQTFTPSEGDTEQSTLSYFANKAANEAGLTPVGSYPTSITDYGRTNSADELLGTDSITLAGYNPSASPVHEPDKEIKLWRDRCIKLTRIISEKSLAAFAFLVDDEITEVRKLKTLEEQNADLLREVTTLREEHKHFMNRTAKLHDERNELEAEVERLKKENEYLIAVAKTTIKPVP